MFSDLGTTIRSLRGSLWTALLGLGPLAAPVASQVEWASQATNVFTIGERGSWDSHWVFANWLMQKDGQYKLWYVGLESGCCEDHQVGCATSTDLMEWTRCTGNPTLPGSMSGQWDDGLFGASVLFEPGDDPPFKLWYSGFMDGLFSNTESIGFATSADGDTWIKFPGNPVHTRAAPGSWIPTSLAFPSVIHDEKRSIFRMWYTGIDWGSCGSTVLGYAESPDGIQWKNYGGNPVLRPEGSEASPYAAKVLFDDDTETFEMWYSGYCEGGIYYATSLDGITWTKEPRNPLSIQGDIAGWPTGGVIRDGSVYRMIHNRNSAGGNTSLSYSISHWTLPKASFTLTPEGGFSPLDVTADGSRAATPNASIDTFEWGFGDGATQTGSGPLASHTYSKLGRHILKLTITDNAGKKGAVARGLNVSLPSSSISPWSAADIGDPVFPGSSSLVGDPACLRLSAGGKMLAGPSDQLHFVYQEVSGDATIQARVSEAAGSDGHWQVGVMLRESLAPGSRHIAMLLSSESSGVRFKSVIRSVPDRVSVDRSLEEASSPDAWIRLERCGDALVASSSIDGNNFSDGILSLTGLPEKLLWGVAAMGSGLRPDGSYEALVAKICEVEGPSDLPPAPGVGPFLRGDCNHDGQAVGTVTDAVFLLNYNFVGGPEPPCAAACDANGDGQFRGVVTDAVYLLSHNFIGGSPPPPPFPQCGRSEAPADTRLGCGKALTGCP